MCKNTNTQSSALSAPCAKCGHPDPSLKYFQKGESIARAPYMGSMKSYFKSAGGPLYTVAILEGLLFTCTRCGYKWCGKTLDSKEA